MWGKKVISFLMVCIFCIGLAGEVRAADAEDEDLDAKIEEAEEGISDAKKEGKELKEQKDEAEKEKKELSGKLDSLLAEVAETEKKIQDKEEEISEKEEELILAQVDENDQYESMKKRIKYMYENGNAQFVEILCNSKDLSDFLNKTEYISSISDYDRDMLAKYQDIVDQVQEQEAALEREQAELEGMQDDLIAKQAEVQALYDTRVDEIAGLKEDIEANAEKLEELEAAKEAAEEAARKKAEAAAAAAAAAAQSTEAGASVVSGNGTFTHPCPGYTRISSTFGYRTAPTAGASTNHKGVDFAAPSGTPIYAAASGTVTSAGYSGNAGNLLVINHGNGLATYYMHCSKIYVSAGQKVEKGQNVAAVGSTGNSTGPHLHFQVMVNGTPVNPLTYL